MCHTVEHKILSLFVKCSLLAPLSVLFIKVLFAQGNIYSYSFIYILSGLCFLVVSDIIVDLFKISALRSSKVMWNHVDPNKITKTKFKISLVLVISFGLIFY